MRTTRSLLAALAVASPLILSAQTPSGPDKGADPLDAAKTSQYYLRYADEIRAKQNMEASHVALRTKAFKDALHNYEPGRLPELHITWGEFVSKSGTVFVAMQLSPSSETYMKPGTKVVAFGELVDGAGKTVLDFEEPANVQESKRDVFVERTFFLPVRRSIGTFGIAAAGEIIALGRSSIDYDELTRTSPGPEVGNDRLPKLATTIEIEGTGRKVRLPATLDPLPLKGVDGHFGLGTTIDLSSFRPGEYRLRLTITDTIAGRVFPREETIKVID